MLTALNGPDVQSAPQAERRRKISRAEMRIRLRLEPYNLTRKETEIAVLLAGVLERKEILQRCGITDNTLKSHIRRIYRKLGVKNRSEIALRLST